jgi:hypothetical protein
MFLILTLDEHRLIDLFSLIRKTGVKVNGSVCVIFRDEDKGVSGSDSESE